MTSRINNRKTKEVRLIFGMEYGDWRSLIAGHDDSLTDSLSNENACVSTSVVYRRLACIEEDGLFAELCTFAREYRVGHIRAVMLVTQHVEAYCGSRVDKESSVDGLFRDAECLHNACCTQDCQLELNAEVCVCGECLEFGARILTGVYEVLSLESSLRREAAGIRIVLSSALLWVLRGNYYEFVLSAYVDVILENGLDAIGLVLFVVIYGEQQYGYLFYRSSLFGLCRAIPETHPEQHESVNDTYLEEQGDTNITIDSLDMSHDREQDDQDDDDLAKERDLVSSLIEKLKCEIDESKNIIREYSLETSLKFSLNLSVLKKLKEANPRSDVIDLKAQLQDKYIAISELKKLIEKMKGKSVETKFEKPLVIRQPNAFKRQRQSVLGKLAKFSNSLAKIDFSKSKSVTTNNVSNEFSNLVTAQILPQNVNIIIVNQSAATPLKRTVATESTNQKPRSIIKKQYEQIIKTCKWWYCKITPPGYKWKPKSRTTNVEPNVSMYLGTKSTTTNILEPSTLRKSAVSNTPSSSNSFAAHRYNFIHRRLWVLKAHDGKSQASKVYYVEGLNHNLFSVGQFCDADLEVAFPKSTCYISDLKGNDLLSGSHSTDLYSITLQDTSTPNPIYLMAKATSSQAYLSKIIFVLLVSWGKQNNRTFVEAARRILSATKVPLFFWAEAIATTCFTQNRSLVIPRHEKTPYHNINGRKPSVKFFHIFGSLCYIVRDGENLDKMKEKGDACIFIGSCQETVPQATETVTTSNELDLLFSLMFDELLNGTNPVVSKSSTERIFKKRTKRKPKTNKSKHGVERAKSKVKPSEENTT
ncbi:integrase, catalytic region, zinc finger, CCHC-type containing protein [Tanacetum coccineum]